MNIAVRTALILAHGLVLSACTVETNQKYFQDPWPQRYSSETRIPTDCSSYTEASSARFSTISRVPKQRLHLRFQYHYNSLAPHVIHQEARQVQTRTGSAFRKLGAPNDGIVTKLFQKRIFVNVYSKKLDDIAHTKTAIARINNII